MASRTMRSSSARSSTWLGAVGEPSPKELAATAVLALSLEEASVKMRRGGPKDEEDDYALPVWAGVLPLVTSWGEPVPDPALPEGIDVPVHIVGRE